MSGSTGNNNYTVSPTLPNYAGMNGASTKISLNIFGHVRKH